MKIPNHPKSLWPGVKAWFGRTYGEHAEEYTDLFDKDTSTQNFEEDVLVTGFNLATVKTEGRGTHYDSETQGYIARAVHVAYSLGFITTREERDDNLYEVVGKRRGQALAFSFRQTKENVGANMYNRAATSGYTGGDGQVLTVTTHPTKSGSQSNILSTAADVSEACLEDMVIQIMGATNDRGLKINLMPQSVHVPRQEWFETNRILKSVLQSNTANNDPNVLRTLNVFPKGIKLNHYFSDSDCIFIRTNCPRGMIYYERVPIEFDQDNDFDTKNAKSAGYERYSFSWTDWRGVYSNGRGA